MTMTNADRTTMTWENQRRARDAYAAGEERGPAIGTPQIAPAWGLDICVIPTMTLRRLTLWGSLAHLWRTGAWKRYVENQARPPAGACWQIGRTIYCREEDYQALKDATRDLT